MNITVTRPDLYSSGRPCFVTDNEAYPGIVGYGDSEAESRASFEAAVAAYVALTEPQNANTEAPSPTSVSWKLVTGQSVTGAFASG